MGTHVHMRARTCAPMHTHTRTHKAQVGSYIHTCTHMPTHAHMCMHTPACVHTHVHMHTHTCTHKAQVGSCMHMCAHMHTHAHTHVHMHTPAHTHTRIHTRIPASGSGQRAPPAGRGAQERQQREAWHWPHSPGTTSAAGSVGKRPRRGWAAGDARWPCQVLRPPQRVPGPLPGRSTRPTARRTERPARGTRGQVGRVATTTAARPVGCPRLPMSLLRGSRGTAPGHPSPPTWAAWALLSPPCPRPAAGLVPLGSRGQSLSALEGPRQPTLK